MFNKAKFKGFTLAEVLITLGIIGVIAAITLPILITTYQKQSTVEKLKKTYTTIMQANTQAVMDYGPISTWDVSLNAEQFTEKYMKPYLNVAESCGTSTSSECWYTFSYLTTSKGTASAFKSYNTSKFYLSDGVIINVGIPNSYRTIVIIDLNGSNPPNIYGKDLFYFGYFHGVGKFLPAGYNYTTSYNLSEEVYGCNTTSGQGITCAAVIMQEGWTISNKYPW